MCWGRAGCLGGLAVRCALFIEMTSKAAAPVYWPGWCRGEEKLKKSLLFLGVLEVQEARAAQVDEMTALGWRRRLTHPAALGGIPALCSQWLCHHQRPGCMDQPIRWAE